MFHLRVRRTQRSLQLAAVVLALSSWLSACGDDEGDDDGGNKGGSSGSAGNAGSSNGGSAGSGTGGSSGSTTGGSAGSATGGTAGATTGGTAGMGGEGGDGLGGEGGTPDGEGGMGQGGQGGAPDAMCTSANLGITEILPPSPQMHDHLPISGAARTNLLNMINDGTPLTFTLPVDGSNPHQHTLTFTPQQLTTLRNGGALAMNITSSMGGPEGNIHTHTYALECQP